jgi:hypothetical protein
MPRIQGLAETPVLTQSQLLKSGPGEVHSITVSWAGATAGNKIAYLIDATSDTGDAGAQKLVVIADAAAGTWNKEWPQGKAFSTGIYYKEGDASQTFTEITFK